MDIQFLINEAKESMLSHGNVMPMIYLELSEGVHMFALDVLSDAQSIPVQCGLLARLGWEECKKHLEQKPLSIGFYAEAWRLREPENNETRLRPVQSEKRQEIISVSFWQDKEPHTQGCVLPVIRDHKKRVIEVGQEALTDHISIQLASFRQGCLDAQKPDEEVFGKYERAIGERIAQLSPEKRQELMDFLRQEGI